MPTRIYYTKTSIRLSFSGDKLLKICAGSSTISLTILSALSGSFSLKKCVISFLRDTIGTPYLASSFFWRKALLIGDNCAYRSFW